MQWYYYPWAGPLIATVAAALLYLTSRAVLKRLQVSQPGWLALIPCVALLAVYGQLGFHLGNLIGVLAAVLFALCYMAVPEGRSAGRVAACVGLALAAYYVSCGLFFLFALLCAMYDLLVRQSRLAVLLWLMSAEAVPYLVGVRLLDVDLSDAFARLLPYHSETDPQGAWALVCLVLSLPLTASLARGWTPVSRRPRMARMMAVWGGAPLWRRALLGVVVVALAAGSSVDRSQKAMLTLERMMRQGEWSQMLSCARALKPDDYTPATFHLVDMALYHTGRLPYEMFSYPQSPQGLLLGIAFPADTKAEFTIRKLSYFEIGEPDLEMGMVSDAEREAYEVLELYGPRPTVLKRLAEIHLIEGRPEAARIVLGAFSKNVIYSQWAQQVLAGLDTGLPADLQDKIQSVRSVMLLDDGHDYVYQFSRRCKALLERNPHNRMAYEYLLAWHLVCRDLDQFVADLARIGDFGYPELPVHYQEAVLLQQAKTGAHVDLHGYAIDPAVESRFHAFMRIVSDYRARGNAAACAAATAREYGNSYFYYCLFGTSGVGRR
jgi:hypothetical protein